MALTRKEFDERLAERNLTPEQKDFLRREYYKDAVKPSLRGKDSQHKRTVITDWGIVAPPANQSARTRDHLVAGFTENAVPGVTDFAKGAARTVLDEGPTALVRRATGAVADAASDAVLKPLGLPTAAERAKMTGSKPGRILPYVAPEQRSASENIGGFVGGFVDPINVAAPLNVFGKAAPVAKGINLLPKAAPPAVLPQVVRGALGAGATNAAIAGVTSAASQTLDGYPIDPNRLTLDAALGGVVGGVLGAGAGGAAGLYARQAAARGEAAALARIQTGAPDAPITGGTVNSQTIDTLNAARRMADQGAPDAYPGSALPDQRVIEAQIDAAKQTGRQMRQGQYAADAASTDLLRPSYEPDMPAPLRPTAGPILRPSGGTTMAERQAAHSAAARAQAEADRIARTTHPVADSPFIEAAAPRIHQNPLMDIEPPAQAPRAAEAVVPQADPQPTPGLLNRLVTEESGQARMPHPDDVRAGVNATIDGGIGAADAVARVVRPIDSLIERAIGATRVDVPMRMAAGVVRRGKDAAKERLRTGLSGGSNELVDNAGRFLVSSKAPTQYQDLKDAIRSQTIRQMQGLTDEAARLEREGVDQEALYDVVTDRTVSNPEAESVRGLTNQVSRDLLDVGSLTPEQQAAWDNQYLPRSYMEKDNAIGSLVRRARKAVSLSGNKRRGKAEDLTREQLAMRQRPWEETGIAADGRVILTDPTDGRTMTVNPRAVGNYTAEWKVVGAAKGGKVKAWRDWTPTEREAMGEMKHVSYALRKIASQAMGDLNNGRLLKAVSENPEWAIKDAEGLTPPEGWVLMDKKTVQANGVRRWGKLADHWVEPTIAADLAAATNNDALGQVVRILRSYTGINQFKKVKVVYNPASHGNQLMQNMITLEAAGGSVSNVPRAARMLRTLDDPTINQFRELGLYGDDYLSTEGMTGAGSNDYLDWGAVAGFPRAVQAFDEAASGLYQFSDNMTRTAYVLSKMDEGVPMEQAIREARERFYNGNTVNSGLARLGSASLLPFVKPTLYTFDRLPELIENNPAKAVKILAYWFAFDQGFKALSGHADDEEGRQALLPDYQKGVAKTIPLPIRDTRGQQLLFDYQRMNPAGSAFGVNDRTGFGPVPEAFVPLGGPLGGLIQVAMNRDAFRDKPLRTKTQNDAPGFMANHWMPGFTGNVQRIGRAMQGVPEYAGGPRYDVPTALAGLIGLKVQPFDAQRGYDQNVRGFVQERDELRAAGNRLGRELESGHISQEEHDRELAELERRLNELLARFEAWDTKAQRGLEAFGDDAQ